MTTQAATSTNTAGATLNGTVTSDGGAPPLIDRGFYWTNTPGVTTNANQLSEGGTTVAAFSKALAGLGPNTNIFYRAYAANSVGTNLGPSDVSFYTLANTPSAPTVGNPTASTLDVTIGSGDGNPAITAYAISNIESGLFVQSGGALGASPAYQTAATWGTKTVTGLTPSTTYTFSVVATNGAGIATSFSPTTSGATIAGAVVPSVSTQAASGTNTSGATLNGTVTADGGASLTDRGFYWTNTPGVTTNAIQLSEGGTSLGAFSKALSGLSPNTNIFYRAYAANSVGTNLGPSDVSFFTLANTPSTPTVGSPTPNSLNVAITPGDGNPANTVYAIQETGSTKYVQTSGSAGGGLGATPVYKTASGWSTTVVTNLSANTTYNFAVVATNGAGIATSLSSTTSGTTLVTPLAAWDFSGLGGIVSQTASSADSRFASIPNLTRGPGAPSSAAGNSFRTTGFKTNGISTANTNYFQATLVTSNEFTLSLSTIDARFAGTASFEPVTNQYAYSLDGTTFTLIGSPQIQAADGPMTQINVSGISALQKIPAGTTVTIRYYASGQTGTGGWGFTSPFLGAYGLSFGGSFAQSFTTNAIQTMSVLTNVPTALLISKVFAKTTGGVAPLTLVSATGAANGTLATNSTAITYTSTGTFVGTDSFNCVVSDANGFLTTVTVLVTVNAANVGPSLSAQDNGSGFATFAASGIPSTTYIVQISTDMVNWADYQTTQAGTNGLINYTDTTSIAAHGNAVFYRLKQQ